TPFGPFVNPNHFAGWMTMALPLALAALLDNMLHAIESGDPRPGRRLAILSSDRSGPVLLIAVSCLVMGLSLVMTQSRSGIAAFAVGELLAGWTLFRRQQGSIARAVVAGSVLLLLGGTAAWAGAEALVSKFTDAQSSKSLNMRVKAWRDTGN